MRNPHRTRGGLHVLVLGFGSLVLLIGCLADSSTPDDELVVADQPLEQEIVPPEPEPLPPFVWDEEARVVRGEFAPDFLLPRLTYSKNADGDPIGIISEENKYRLAAHFGDRPICLIMSSFT